MSKLRGGIPTAKEARTGDLDAFVSGARGKATHPWLEPHVRTDLHVQLNVKMPEKLMLQIAWLAAEIGEPKRGVVEAALEEYAARELKRRGAPA